MMYEEKQGSNTNKAIESVIKNSNFYESYIIPHQVCEKFDQSVEALKENPEMLELFLKANNANLKDIESSIMDLVSSVNSSAVDADTLIHKLKLIKEHEDVESVDLTERNLKITLADGAVINSKSLSKTMGWNEETTDHISSSLQMTIELAQTLPYETKVVTGWVHGETDKHSQLNTWLEAYIDGKMVVIDTELDSIMNKDGYYHLRGAKQISAINNYDLKTDIDKITPYMKSGKITGLQYLILRDELMTILRENEQ